MCIAGIESVIGMDSRCVLYSCLNPRTCLVSDDDAAPPSPTIPQISHHRLLLIRQTLGQPNYHEGRPPKT